MSTAPDDMARYFADRFPDLLIPIVSLLQAQHLAPEEFYDNADVKRILQVSDRTLYTLRRTHSIPFMKIGRSFYYPSHFFTQAAAQAMAIYYRYHPEALPPTDLKLPPSKKRRPKGKP